MIGGFRSNIRGNTNLTLGSFSESCSMRSCLDECDENLFSFLYRYKNSRTNDNYSYKGAQLYTYKGIKYLHDFCNDLLSIKAEDNESSSLTLGSFGESCSIRSFDICRIFDKRNTIRKKCKWNDKKRYEY